VIRERRGAPVVVGDVTLTPIERLTIRSTVTSGVVLFSGSKEPLAILVERGGEQFTLELASAGPSAENASDRGRGRT
jgi:hypothetical protein